MDHDESIRLSQRGVPLRQPLLQFHLGQHPLVLAVQIRGRLHRFGPRGHHHHPVLHGSLLAGSGQQRGLEFADVAGDVRYLAILVNVDQRMALHASDGLAQQSLGVLVAEAIVDVPQMTTQLRLPFHQVHLVPLIGDGERRRHPRKPPADNQGAVCQLKAQAGQRTQQPRLGHRHAYQLLGLESGQLRIGAVHPGILLAQVGHLKEVGVQPRLAECILEQRLVSARRARGHHHAVQPILLDPLPDALLRVLGAGVEIVLGVGYSGQGPGVLHHLGHVHHRADVDAAMTDENAHPWLLIGDVPLRRILFDPRQRAPRGR